jgi:STE24 endopeptidase
LSRLLPLLPLVLWLSYTPTRGDARPGWMIAAFLGGFATLPLLLRLWASRLLRGEPGTLYRRAGRFQGFGVLARLLLVIWFGVRVFGLGWGWSLARLERTLPTSIVATLAVLPMLLGWLAVAWAQFPVERRWREHNVLLRFDELSAIHPPPTLWQHLDQTLRLQLLFTLTPVFVVMLLRDGIGGTLTFLRIDPKHDWIATLASAAIVFVSSPLLLTRVLRTSPLPDGPLRSRLIDYGRRISLRAGSIRLWHTHHSLSNAAVMGVVPWVRSVVLSDALIESLDAGQVEAVFAHEAGHIHHRHMLWYLLFLLVATLSLGVPMTWLLERFDAAGGWAEIVLTTLAVIGWTLLFGVLSRRCERQADWYAARTIDEPAVGGERFAETLRRVAIVNGMPLSRRSPTGRPLADLAGRAIDATAHFLHGSIASRMVYVRQLSGDAALARSFAATQTLIFTTIFVAAAIVIGVTIRFG